MGWCIFAAQLPLPQTSAHSLRFITKYGWIYIKQTQIHYRKRKLNEAGKHAELTTVHELRADPTDRSQRKGGLTVSELRADGLSAIAYGDYDPWRRPAPKRDFILEQVYSDGRPTNVVV